jgi:cellulose biosynthesis protein BcsQ
MHTVAVFTAKGGSGKSALTVFVAEFLASTKLHKKRVLVVDLDPQQSAAVALLGEERLYGALREGRTLDDLLCRVIQGQRASLATTEAHLIRRAAHTGGRYNFLGPLAVLAADREGWHNLNDELRDANRAARQSEPATNRVGGTIQAARGSLTPGQEYPVRPTLPPYLDALRSTLACVKDGFDVCLIDFPAHGRGPLVQCGLWAADWWLYPVQPDRLGTRDLDSSLASIRRAFRGQRRIKGLGTVLNLCQNRNDAEYKRAKAVLQARAGQKTIPALFSRDAEIDFSPAAKKALDETLQVSTVRQKFGDTEKAFCTSLRYLVREILARLGQPAADIDPREAVNPVMTREWTPARPEAARSS